MSSSPWNQAISYISRNKELSLATIIVVSITFLIGSFFYGSVTIAHRIVQHLEQQPHLIILYQPQTDPDTILQFKQELEQKPEILAISYTDQKTAMRDYIAQYETNAKEGDLNPEKFPPNLKIKMKSIQDIDKIKNIIQDQKDSDTSIKEVLSLPDVINRIRFISNLIRFGGLTVVVFLLIISITLILITIGFNISRYGTEIEIMQLIGATPNSIMLPFTMQGGIYGLAGSLVSSLVLLTVFIVLLVLVKSSGGGYNTDSSSILLVNNFFRDLSLTRSTGFNIYLFVTIFIILKIFLGTVLGFLSGYAATKKYIH